MKDSNINSESSNRQVIYEPKSALNSLRAPLYQTSTFVFDDPQQAKDYFEIAYGKREKRKEEKMGMSYSRIDNPNVAIFEKQLCLFEKAVDCAAFESGMAAVSTVMLTHLKPGTLLLYSTPLYGGTDVFIKNELTKFNIEILAFGCNEPKQAIIDKVVSFQRDFNERAKEEGRAPRECPLSLIYIETPANPTNDMVDIAMCSEIAKHFTVDPESPVVLAVDNTYLGPLWQAPLTLGADLVIYSATKYIAGHSDLIAGAVLGSEKLLKRLKVLRVFLGNIASPFTCWLLCRSLDTLKIRMEQQASTAAKVARFLNGQGEIEKVYYLGNLSAGTPERELYDRQCKGNGAMISFDLKGGEKQAFRFLDAIKLVKLAVSLGSTESLAEHPFTMTHVGMELEDRLRFGITDKMVRLSVGIEDADDIIEDLRQALAKSVQL